MPDGNQRPRWLSAKVGFAVALVVVAATGAAALARFFRPPPLSEQPTIALQIKPDELNLGVIDETEALTHTLTITNAGREPVAITRVHRSCECVEMGKIEGEALAPGESKTLPLRIKVQLPGKADLARTHPFTTTVAAEYKTEDGTPRTTEWTLAATVHPVFRASASSLDFGTVSHYSTGIEQELTLTTAPDIDAVECGAGSAWRVKAEAVGGSQHRVTVRSASALALGALAGELTVVPVRAGRRLEARKIALKWRVVEDVQPVVPSIHFGRRKVGTAGKETLTFRSLTGQPFKVVDANASSPALRIVAAEGAFVVQLDFAKSGDVEEAARFEVEDAKGRRFTLAVPVRYFGS